MRRASASALAGMSASIFRGRGLSYLESRPYLPGDEVRDLDWKATARIGRPFVKRFVQDRQQTILLLVDTSPSMSASGAIGVGSAVYPNHARTTKLEFAAEIAGLSAAVAVANLDRVGLVSFGGALSIVSPSLGDRLPARIVNGVLRTSEEKDIVSLEEAAGRLGPWARCPSVVLVVSDFARLPFRPVLGKLARRHEVYALDVRDPWEIELPDGGLVRWRDAESGSTRTLDTSDPRVRAAYSSRARQRQRQLGRDCRAIGAVYLPLSTDRPPVEWLLRYFAR